MKNHIHKVWTIGLLAIIIGLIGCSPATSPTSTKPASTTPPAKTASSLPPISTKPVSAPGIMLNIEIGSVTANGVNITIKAGFSNGNSIPVEVSTLNFTAKGDSGNIYLQDSASAGIVAAGETTTFNHNSVLPLEVLGGTKIFIYLETEARAGERVIPLSATVPVQDINKAIPTPKMDVSFNLGKLKREGMDSKLTATINNPYPLTLNIVTMRAFVNNQSGSLITQVSVPGSEIGPNSSKVITSDILLPTNVLNENRISINVDAMATFKGVSVPFKSTITLNIPEFIKLITVPECVVEVKSSDWRNAYPIPDVTLEVKGTIKNDNYVDFSTTSLKFSVYDNKNTRIQETVLSASPRFPAASTIEITNPLVLKDSIKGLVGTKVTIKYEIELKTEGVNAEVAVIGSLLYALEP